MTGQKSIKEEWNEIVREYTIAKIQIIYIIPTGDAATKRIAKEIRKEETLDKLSEEMINETREDKRNRSNNGDPMIKQLLRIEKDDTDIPIALSKWVLRLENAPDQIEDWGYEETDAWYELLEEMEQDNIRDKLGLQLRNIDTSNRSDEDKKKMGMLIKRCELQNFWHTLEHNDDFCSKNV